MTAADRTDLATLLARVGTELAALTALAQDLQFALSDCAPNPPAAADTLAGLQSVDRITQTLSDLSRLIAALSDGPAQHGQPPGAELADMVVLRDLAARLFPAPGGQTAPAEPEATGEILWF